MQMRSVSKENSNSSFKIRQRSNKRNFSLEKPLQYKMTLKVPQPKNPPSAKKLILKSISENRQNQIYYREDLNISNSNSQEKKNFPLNINDFQLNEKNYNESYLEDKCLKPASKTENCNKSQSAIQSQFMDQSLVSNKSVNHRIHRHSDILKRNTKIQLQQQESKEKSSISQKNEVSTQTDKVQFERESYQQFMRFKIGKKEKFVKFQNLFEFIQNLTSVQEQNFKNNVKEIKQTLEKQQLTGARQARVNQLMQNIPNTFEAFNKEFKTVFARQQQILKSIIKKQRFISKRIKDSQKDLLKNIENLFCHKDLFKQQVKFKEIKQLFNEAAKQQQILFQQNSDYITKKIIDSEENLSYLTNAFERIQNNIIEQQTLIKNCVKSISQLPELCMSIFGMKNLDSRGEENMEIKKFGVNMNTLPSLSDFFVGKNHNNAKEVDEAFLKCCDIKCMNCTYLRTKMKYIQRKNIQLKPIVKVLYHLVNWKHKRFMSLQ